MPSSAREWHGTFWHKWPGPCHWSRVSWDPTITVLHTVDSVQVQGCVRAFVFVHASFLSQPSFLISSRLLYLLFSVRVCVLACMHVYAYTYICAIVLCNMTTLTWCELFDTLKGCSPDTTFFFFTAKGSVPSGTFGDKSNTAFTLH